jgi:hypothetical protein
MAGPGIPLAIGGSVLSAESKMQAGAMAGRLGAAQDAALQEKATQELAAGSGQAADQALQTKYVLASVRARAAGLGTDAGGISPVDLAGQIAARGSYNQGYEVGNAGQIASGTAFQGALAQYSGTVEKQAAPIQAMSTVLSGIGGLAAKYGNKGGPFGTSDTTLP